MYFIIVLWLHCFILQVVMVRINWIHMVCWSSNLSFHVMLFCFPIVLLLIFVLSLHCFILQVVMVRINWMHMIRWSGDPSFNVMLLCFHVLLFCCFITSLFYSTGCHGEDQLDAHDMLIRWSVILLCFIVLALHCFILQVAMVRINWMYMIYWSGDASFNAMLCFHIVLLLHCFIL